MRELDTLSSGFLSGVKIGLDRQTALEERQQQAQQFANQQALEQQRQIALEKYKQDNTSFMVDVPGGKRLMTVAEIRAQQQPSLPINPFGSTQQNLVGTTSTEGLQPNKIDLAKVSKMGGSS